MLPESTLLRQAIYGWLAVHPHDMLFSITLKPIGRTWQVSFQWSRTDGTTR